MKKQYMKPELETVEVMVELGFAESQTRLEPTASEDATARFLDADGTTSFSQGEQWETVSSWLN